MKGVQIFLHSLRQVLGNFDGAIKVSALPFLIQFLVGLLLVGTGAAMGPAMMTQGGMANAGHMGGFGFAILVSSVVTLVMGLWVAVAWHRFVLLGEAPQGYVPPFRSDRIAAYFLRCLGLIVILIIGGMVLGAIGGLIAMPLMQNGAYATGGIVLAIIVYLPLTLIGFRLATSLPGQAIGADQPFLAGWQATKGQTADLLVLVVLAVAAQLVVSLLGVFVFSRITVLFVIWQLAVGWLVMMVGVSILTTLYGHYIEKRSLL